MATFVISDPQRLYYLDSSSFSAIAAATTSLVSQNSVGDVGDVQSDDEDNNNNNNQVVMMVDPHPHSSSEDHESPNPPTNSPSSQVSSSPTYQPDEVTESTEPFKTQKASGLADDANIKNNKDGVEIIPSLASQAPPTATSTAAAAVTSQHRPRVFLGVWIRLGHDTDSGVSRGLGLKLETRRERILRHTYLEMDYRYKSNDTICSYKELQKKAPKHLNPNACRLVYVYFRMEPMRLRPWQIYVKVDKKHKKQRINPNVAIPAFMNWAQQTQQEERNIIGDIDYFAVATSEALILPTLFWNENAMLNSSTRQPYSTIGFLPNPNCTITHAGGILPSKNATRTTTCLDPHFVCLSKDLASLAAKAVNQTVVEPKTTPPVDHLYHSLQEHIQKSSSSSSSEVIRIVPMKGVASVPHPIDGVRAWAKYVESSINFTDPIEEARVRNGHTKVATFQGQPRILAGIFTTLSEKDRERRRALRDTYLQHYVNSTTTPHRICTVRQLLEKEVREEDCQYAYTFVVAANPNGGFTYTARDNIDGYSVKDLQNVPNASEPEPDVLYLNIRENMNDGKSDTWFRYASLLSDTLYFDYIAKVDTDTFLRPTEFFSFMSTWPTFPNNVRIYGGRYIVWGRHGKAYGHTYMAGHLYWMSPDLARFMGFSPTVNRRLLCTEMEDMTSGSYVNMMPNLIHHIELDESVADHTKKLKRAKIFRQAYTEYLNKTQSRRATSSPAEEAAP